MKQNPRRGRRLPIAIASCLTLAIIPAFGGVSSATPTTNVAAPAILSPHLTGYTLVDLGANLWPFAVNDSDQVVGQDVTPYPAADGGFLWQNGVVTSLKGLDGNVSANTLPTDINNAGRIVGTAVWKIVNYVDYYHAAWWSTAAPQTAHDIGYLGGNADYSSEATHVNAAGDVVGWGSLSNSASPGFFQAAVGGTLTQVGTGLPPGGPLTSGESTYPCGLADTGEILVSVSRHSTSGIFPVPNPGGTGSALGFSVECNQAANHPMSGNGKAVGYRYVNGYTTPVIRQPNGVVTALGSASGASQLPYAVNDEGTAAGLGTDGHAAVWENGVQVSLTPFAPAGWSFQNAVDINSQGDIVGYGALNGKGHGWLLKRTGTFGITNVAIAPTSPKITDTSVTVTITVTNGTSSPLTNVSAGLTSNTPSLVTVATAPTPANRATLAAGASTTFTAKLTGKGMAGAASLRITSTAHDGSTVVTATPRTRTFTIGAALRVALALAGPPDAAGRAVVRATVTNPNLSAVSGITLALRDATGGRLPAAFGRPAPASFALASHQVKSFTATVVLPGIGAYRLGSTATGHSGATAITGNGSLNVRRAGAGITVTVTPHFATLQAGQKGTLTLKIVNHLNENLASNSALLSVVAGTGRGKASIGTIPPPPAVIASGATLTVPATFTYPGPVTFVATVRARGARTAAPVVDSDQAKEIIPLPTFTAVRSSAKVVGNDALAADYTGGAWSSVGGPITLKVGNDLYYTYTQRAAFHGTLGRPLWPNRGTTATQGCWADISAQQGSYKKVVRLTGRADRRLLFADADPNLSTGMMLCDKELNYVNHTPGTALYITASPGHFTALTGAQAGKEFSFELVLHAGLKACFNLTDGIRSLHVSVPSNAFVFSLSATRCT